MYWFIRFSTQWRSRLTRELLLRSICTVRACATWRYRRISPGQCQGMRSLYSCQLRQQLVPGSRALLRQIHTSRSYLKQRLNRRAMRSDGATRSLRISRLVIAATVPTARQAVRAPAAHQNSALHLTKSKSELWALPLIQCLASQSFRASREDQVRALALAQSCRRRSCTFFSTTPFSQPAARLQNSGSNR